MKITPQGEPTWPPVRHTFPRSVRGFFALLFLLAPLEAPADSTSIIYLTDFKANIVQKFSTTGVRLGTAYSTVSPTGLAFDSAGNLFVASDDALGNSIRKVAPDGTATVFATDGLNAPHGLAIDPFDNVFVANAQGDTIMKYTPDGAFTVFADASMGLSHPTDLLFDATGTLFVTNAFGGPARTGSVQKFAPDGSATVFADSGFNAAYGLAIDAAGNVYVSNFSGNTVQKFAANGSPLGIFASTPLNGPHGMCFDGDGNLLVANNLYSRIEKFSPTGTYLGVFAPTGAGPHFFAINPPLPTPTPTPSPTPSATPTPSPTATPTPTPSPPAIVTQPQNQAVSLGQTATFSVTATGTEPLAYQWQKNGAAIPDAIQASYTTPPATAGDSGSVFQVTVSNAAGSVISNQAILTVNLPPTITVQPQSRNVAVGKSVRVSVTATGSGPLTYQWYKNGTAIANATEDFYRTPPVVLADNGSTFYVVVTNPYGSTASVTVTLNVH